MGFFTLEIARRVGPAGRVIAVDIQPKMLSVLRRHSVAAGLQDRVETRLVQPDSIGARDLAGKVDFALVFAVVHEMPDAARFFRELGAALKIGGTVLLAEPAGHVKAARFDQELAAATEAGLATVDRPELRRAHTAVLRKE